MTKVLFSFHVLRWNNVIVVACISNRYTTARQEALCAMQNYFIDNKMLHMGYIISNFICKIREKVKKTTPHAGYQNFGANMKSNSL